MHLTGMATWSRLPSLDGLEARHADEGLDSHAPAGSGAAGGRVVGFSSPNRLGIDLNFDAGVSRVLGVEDELAVYSFEWG